MKLICHSFIPALSLIVRKGLLNASEQLLQHLNTSTKIYIYICNSCHDKNVNSDFTWACCKILGCTTPPPTTLTSTPTPHPQQIMCIFHRVYYGCWSTAQNLYEHIPICSSVSPPLLECTVYPKKYAHSFWFAGLCCGYTLTDFPISIRLTSLALWQSNDCPSASKTTLMNMDKYFMWIHYERLHNHNKAKHKKTVCIFLGIYCICPCCHGL